MCVILVQAIEVFGLEHVQIGARRTISAYVRASSSGIVGLLAAQPERTHGVPERRTLDVPRLA